MLPRCVVISSVLASGRAFLVSVLVSVWIVFSCISLQVDTKVYCLLSRSLKRVCGGMQGAATLCKGTRGRFPKPQVGSPNRLGSLYVCFVTQVISVAVLPEWRQVQRERRSPLPVPFPLTCRPLGRRSDSNMQVGRPFLLCAPRSERNGEDYVEEFAA